MKQEVIVLRECRIVERWKHRAGQLKVETYALYWAYRDPRTPWYAKALAALVVGYAFSPLDLIPDFIPVLGYLDDLVLVPLGVVLLLKLIPGAVMDESRQKAHALMEKDGPVSWIAAGLIATVWLLSLGLVIFGVVRAGKR